MAQTVTPRHSALADCLLKSIVAYREWTICSYFESVMPKARQNVIVKQGVIVPANTARTTSEDGCGFNIFVAALVYMSHAAQRARLACCCGRQGRQRPFSVVRFAMRACKAE